MNGSGAIVRRPDERPVWAVAGDLYDVLIGGEETGGGYALLRTLVRPGGGPPPHVHTREDESFLVQAGELAFTVGGERIVAGPGTFLHAPRNIEHCFRNEGTIPAELLVWLSPAGFEPFFTKVGSPLPAGSRTAPPPTPEHLADLLEVAPRYGIQIRMPA